MLTHSKLAEVYKRRDYRFFKWAIDTAAKQNKAGEYAVAWSKNMEVIEKGRGKKYGKMFEQYLIAEIYELNLE